MNKKERPEPKPGDRFQHRLKRKLIFLEAIETDAGIRFKIDIVPGIEFKSFTAAAKYLLPEGQAVNGRKYWNPVANTK